MAVPNFRSIAFYATTIGHYSLMPLIPTKAETPAVLFMFLSYTTIHWLALFRLHPASAKADMYQTNGPLGRLASMHLWGLVPLYVASFILWPLLWMNSGLPFLPLMATSMYTAIGLCLGYVYFLWLSWQSDEASAVVVTEIEGTHQVKEREVKVKQERTEKKTDEKQRTMERKFGEKPPATERTLEGRQQEKSVPPKSNKKKAKKLKSH
ncbi:glycosyl transferase [Clonorchis sinensis]|nr:glycosyl transferase [Clonorchis sinensis]